MAAIPTPRAAIRRVVWGVALLVTLLSCTDSGELPGPSGVPGEREVRTGAHWSTTPPGQPLPSDAQCAARVERDPWEPRSENSTANRTVPDGPVVSRGWGSPEADALKSRVTGAFTGTTDELIQWASCKWGFDPDLTRAQAVQESGWVQSARGDGGVSFGLLQIKSVVWTGTAPWSLSSTAYNLDWSLGMRRACYEGYLYTEEGSRGDLWGCIGVHFSGRWKNESALRYSDSVKRHLHSRSWRDWPSPAGGVPP
ncbi:MAG: hypothetical protein AVDCRST_MAG66-3426 [uncultured Pseudonocardia sp.]|uniref:Transglycosylase SLT domain-containing protein n=1 Tax=uncultured Pseudonocardia sp. TaxID=211455 RepID=A0A6J4QAS0_9PSEU|nr:MAG: hypothetical protein AVDCRST_MAG66-3426 [uncultured Pseudonocardia sp.]